MNKQDKYPFLCLCIYLLVFIFAAINPKYPFFWFLENIVSTLTVLILILTYKKFRFSNAAYTLITMHIVFHTIASHYTYGETPFMNFITQMFGFARNQYDRIVHFMFGLFWYLPALEISRRLFRSKEKNWFVYVTPMLILMGLGAIYEVLEWLSALVIDPHNIATFLGTQGDAWDTQKDLYVKFIGSAIAGLFFYFKKS